MPIRIPGAGEEEGGGGPTPRGPMVTTISLDALNPRQQLFDLPPGLAISRCDALNRADWCRQTGVLSLTCARATPADETNR